MCLTALQYLNCDKCNNTIEDVCFKMSQHRVLIQQDTTAACNRKCIGASFPLEMPPPIYFGNMYDIALHSTKTMGLFAENVLGMLGRFLDGSLHHVKKISNSEHLFIYLFIFHTTCFICLFIHIFNALFVFSL